MLLKLIYERFRQLEWQKLLETILTQVYQGETYILLYTIIEVGIATFIYKSMNFEEDIRVNGSVFVGTGPFWLANKGALSSSLVITSKSSSEKDKRQDHAPVSICFVNSHLSPHASGLKKRRNEFLGICQRTIFDNEQGGGVLSRIWSHDIVVWFGDLNYRIDEEFIKRESIFKILVDNPREKQYSQVKKVDQLSREIQENRAFPTFQEGTIDFEPTFKYDVGTRNSFDSSKKARTPAWCDRILWSFGPIIRQPQKQQGFEDLVKVSSLSLNKYTSCMDFTVSDHKPIGASFSLNPQKFEDYVRKEGFGDGHPLLKIDAYYRLKRRIGYLLGLLIGFILWEPRLLLLSFSVTVLSSSFYLLKQ